MSVNSRRAYQFYSPARPYEHHDFFKAVKEKNAE